MPLSFALDDLVIVIVDDNDGLRFSLTEFLARLGATVIACSDAIDGLAAVRVHHPDLVLSDIGLPNRDGFLLLQDIRSLAGEHGGEVPVIAMTAFADIGEHSRTNSSRFQGHLTKPFNPDQLLTVIYSTLQSAGTGSPLDLEDPNRFRDQ